MKSTPHWLRNIATFGSWPNVKRAHRPYGATKINAAERRERECVPLLMNVQDRDAIRDAHRMGARALSYLSFYDTFVHTAGFENGTARVPWDPQRPQILLLDEQHRFVNTPMDGSWRMWRYLVCNNTREFIDMALAIVHEQMRRGADGIFLDNADHREPCHGHGVHVGYSPRYRMVCTAMPEVRERLRSRAAKDGNPHHGGRRGVPASDVSLKEMPRHRHVYPDSDHDHAFVKLLQKVRQVVRSYGHDKVLLVNGPTFAAQADGGMLESFIFSWVGRGRRQTWPEIKRAAEKWAPYLRDGGTIQALSYLGCTDRSIEEDAVYAYAAAKLCGYMWSDYQTGKSHLCRRLRGLNLGRSLTPMLGNETINYRVFARGLVAVSEAPRSRTLSLELPPSQKAKDFYDLYGKRRVEAIDGRIRLTVPARGAVVCSTSSGLSRSSNKP